MGPANDRTDLVAPDTAGLADVCGAAHPQAPRHPCQNDPGHAQRSHASDRGCHQEQVLSWVDGGLLHVHLFDASDGQYAPPFRLEKDAPLPPVECVAGELSPRTVAREGEEELVVGAGEGQMAPADACGAIHAVTGAPCGLDKHGDGAHAAATDNPAAPFIFWTDEKTDAGLRKHAVCFAMVCLRCKRPTHPWPEFKLTDFEIEALASGVMPPHYGCGCGEASQPMVMLVRVPRADEAPESAEDRRVRELRESVAGPRLLQ